MKATLLFFTAAALLPAEAPVPGFPIGRCVRVIGVTAPEDAVKAGFEYVELALQDILALPEEEFERTVRRIKGLGLPALSGYGFVPADLKVVGPDVDHKRVDEQVRRGIDRAARLGLQMVVFGNLNGQSRRVPDEFDRDRALMQLIRFARGAAAEGRQRGITVLIEPMPARSTNLINTVEEGFDLVRQVNDDRFQLLADFSFMVQGKEDLSILHKAARSIRQVEISNPNGRVYPRNADEGDYASFFRALEKGGYRGGISIHGAPKDFWVDAPRAIALLRREVSRP